MEEHARLSPSSSERWINCPSSIQLCESIPTEDELPHPITEEGTTAHRMAEDCLKNRYNPFSVDKVPQSWACYIATYLRYVWKRISETSHYWVEKRVKYDDEVWGTSDCIVWDENSKVLEVIDLKFGYNPVSANSSQLSIYAIAAAKTLDIKPTTVVQTIVQPRISHHSTYSRPFSDLEKWSNTTLKLAVHYALNGKVKRYRAGSWCEYCSANKVCTKFRMHGTFPIEDNVEK